MRNSKYSLRLTLLITVFINVHYIFGQEDNGLNDALKRVTEVSSSGNPEDMLQLTSPRLIKAMGGKENALKIFKQAFLSMADNGLKIDTVINYNNVGMAEIDNIRYSFFPQLIVMSIPDKDKKMISVTTLLALKEPSTEDWTFLDYNQLTDEQLNFLLPEFKDKALFPRGLSEKPLVIPKDEVTQSIQHLMQIIDQSIKKRKELDGRS